MPPPQQVLRRRHTREAAADNRHATAQTAVDLPFQQLVRRKDVRQARAWDAGNHGLGPAGHHHHLSPQVLHELRSGDGLPQQFHTRSRRLVR